MLAEIGKTLVILGLSIIFVGVLLWLSGDKLLNLPLTRLSGDISIQKDNFSFYFPLGTCILLSIFISGLIWFWQLISR